MLTDLSLDELQDYRSSQSDPDDFDAFWGDTLAQARRHGIDVRTRAVDTGLTTVEVHDVTFAGFGGEPVKGWLRLPAGANGPLPAVVQFVGYGGGRGAPFDELVWASCGYAHLVMDTRGQGSGWSEGATPDPHGAGPHGPGFLTRGIERREDYYYRRVLTDAVRAVEAARALPVVDPRRVAVVGGSQGGGIALAVAGLVPDVAGLLSFAPFLCDFPRAVMITDRDPYKEIGRYLAVHRERVEEVLALLSYFDGVNFARRAQAPAWFSTALMDPTCPPSTVYGAYHAYAGEKRMAVWPFNGHEAGQSFDTRAGIDALRELFAPGR